MKRRLGEANLLTGRTEKGTVEFRNSLKDGQKIERCRRMLAL
jgi:hypothetical protein